MIAQLQNEMMQPVFWLAFSKILWIDVLLSGDNALVIAMACRGLPARQRFWGMILGAGAAVAMRVVFTGVIATVMEMPYLKMAGGLALLFVATKLLVPEPEGEDGAKTADRLWRAIIVIVIADATMSLDNVIAVAAAANGSLLLLAIGLAVSIPLVVAGAALITGILNRFPVLIWAGAALLGWIAGEVIATDPAIKPLLAAPYDSPFIYAVAGCVFVLIAGAIWRSRTAQEVAA